MAEDGKWKSKLLSSSVPLEYEVARLLVAAGFSVRSDYAYSRQDEGYEKDFSVDIHAHGFPPFTSENNLKSSLSILVECKHRHRGVRWLFFPDPNQGTSSFFFSGATLHAIDNFSPKFFPYNPTGVLEDLAPSCLKGVEISTERGDAHDAEIRRGLLQIQYGLPRLLSNEIGFAVTSHSEDQLPFFYCGVLVTTAPLFVARADLRMEDVEQAEKLEDIGSEVPWLITHVDPGPDFEKTRARECAALAGLKDNEGLRKLDEVRLAAGELDFNAPSRVCSELCSENSTCDMYFSQIFVCSFAHLNELLSQVKMVASKAARRLANSRPQAPWEKRGKRRGGIESSARSTTVGVLKS